MSITLPKISIGTKNVIVNEPAWLSSLFANHMFAPVITPLKIERGGVVMYSLQVRDLNTDRTMDVVFACPERLSHTVKLASSMENNGELVAEWETNDIDSKTFKDDINRCLEYWLTQIQQASSFGNIPKIRSLQAVTKLKWPWKSGSNEDYFKKFRPETHTHQFKLGVGYYNQEYDEVGVTLQLSSYPGNTLAVIEESRQRKRAKRARAEVEAESPGVESTLPDITE